MLQYCLLFMFSFFFPFFIVPQEELSTPLETTLSLPSSSHSDISQNSFDTFSSYESFINNSHETLAIEDLTQVTNFIHKILEKPSLFRHFLLNTAHPTPLIFLLKKISESPFYNPRTASSSIETIIRHEALQSLIKLINQLEEKGTCFFAESNKDALMYAVKANNRELVSYILEKLFISREKQETTTSSQAHTILTQVMLNNSWYECDEEIIKQLCISYYNSCQKSSSLTHYLNTIKKALLATIPYSFSQETLHTIHTAAILVNIHETYDLEPHGTIEDIFIRIIRVNASSRDAQQLLHYSFPLLSPPIRKRILKHAIINNDFFLTHTLLTTPATLFSASDLQEAFLECIKNDSTSVIPLLLNWKSAESNLSTLAVIPEAITHIQKTDAFITMQALLKAATSLTDHADFSVMRRAFAPCVLMLAESNDMMLLSLLLEAKGLHGNLITYQEREQTIKTLIKKNALFLQDLLPLFLNGKAIKEETERLKMIESILLFTIRENKDWAVTPLLNQYAISHKTGVVALVKKAFKKAFKPKRGSALAALYSWILSNRPEALHKKSQTASETEENQDTSFSFHESDETSQSEEISTTHLPASSSKNHRSIPLTEAEHLRITLDTAFTDCESHTFFKSTLLPLLKRSINKAEYERIAIIGKWIQEKNILFLKELYDTTVKTTHDYNLFRNILTKLAILKNLPLDPFITGIETIIGTIIRDKRYDILFLLLQCQKEQYFTSTPPFIENNVLQDTSLSIIPFLTMLLEWEDYKHFFTAPRLEEILQAILTKHEHVSCVINEKDLKKILMWRDSENNGVSGNIIEKLIKKTNLSQHTIDTLLIWNTSQGGLLSQNGIETILSTIALQDTEGTAREYYAHLIEQKNSSPTPLASSSIRKIISKASERGVFSTRTLLAYQPESYALALEKAFLGNHDALTTTLLHDIESDNSAIKALLKELISSTLEPSPRSFPYHLTKMVFVWYIENRHCTVVEEVLIETLQNLPSCNITQLLTDLTDLDYKISTSIVAWYRHNKKYDALLTLCFHSILYTEKKNNIRALLDLYENKDKEPHFSFTRQLLSLVPILSTSPASSYEHGLYSELEQHGKSAFIKEMKKYIEEENTEQVFQLLEEASSHFKDMIVEEIALEIWEAAITKGEVTLLEKILTASPFSSPNHLRQRALGRGIRICAYKGNQAATFFLLSKSRGHILDAWVGAFLGSKSILFQKLFLHNRAQTDSLLPFFFSRIIAPRFLELSWEEAQPLTNNRIMTALIDILDTAPKASIKYVIASTLFPLLLTYQTQAGECILSLINLKRLVQRISKKGHYSFIFHVIKRMPYLLPWALAGALQGNQRALIRSLFTHPFLSNIAQKSMMEQLFKTVVQQGIHENLDLLVAWKTTQGSGISNKVIHESFTIAAQHGYTQLVRFFLAQYSFIDEEIKKTTLQKFFPHENENILTHIMSFISDRTISHDLMLTGLKEAAFHHRHDMVALIFDHLTILPLYLPPQELIAEILHHAIDNNHTSIIEEVLRWRYPDNRPINAIKSVLKDHKDIPLPLAEQFFTYLAEKNISTPSASTTTILSGLDILAYACTGDAQEEATSEAVQADAHDSAATLFPAKRVRSSEKNAEPSSKYPRRE